MQSGHQQRNPATSTEEQAFDRVGPDGGAYAPGAFVLALGGVRCLRVLSGLARESAPMIAADQAAENQGRDS